MFAASHLMPVLSLIFAAAAASLATKVAIKISVARGYLDWPNERSAHTGPVPRVGGVAIMGVFVASLMAEPYIRGWNGKTGFMGSRLSLASLIIASVLGVVGFYDDVFGLKPFIKLGWQVVTAVAAICLMVASWHSRAFGPTWVTAVVEFVWLVSFSNFFNFMDGANGMAAGSGTIFATFLALFGSLAHDQPLTTISLMLAGCCLGFLTYNFPRAKAFMGDSGSLPLGMLFSFLSIELAHSALSTGAEFAGFLICALFVFDCVVTLGVRLVRSENLLKAHQAHLYQELYRAGWTHPQVSIIYWMITIFLGLLGLAASNAGASNLVLILVTAFVVLILFFLTVRWITRYRTA